MTITARNNYASVLASLERFADAEPHARAAVAGMERRLGLTHPSTASARVNLGRALAGLDRFTEAEQELLGAERVFASAVSVQPSVHAKCLDALVQLYTRWESAESGRGASAEPWKAKREELARPAPTHTPR